MANDRMWLSCPYCPEATNLLLAKTLGDGWYVKPREMGVENELDSWFSDHAACSPTDFPSKPELVFESEL